MKKIFAVSASLLMLFITLPHAASAARPTKPGGGGSTTTELIGYDVSYPQCGRTLPTNHAFAVVGVNGGNAATFNECLATQLSWANQASGLVEKQPKVQLYVNTANPAQDPLYTWSSWPTSSTENNPYKECSGERTNSLACSWQYGWNRSIEAEAYFASQAAVAGISPETIDYTWWLDVETMNSWQSGSADALSRNRAALEGFAAYYQDKGAQVGLYSTAYQWGVIAGTTLISEGNLAGLPNWRPSGATLANAKKNCKVAPLTAGGFISMTQYVKNNLDHNHSCI
jgi:hypothetical protein